MAYHRAMELLAALPDGGGPDATPEKRARERARTMGEATEYMGGSGTHITDYDPETGKYGPARYERRHGEGPPKEVVDRWVAAFNSGARVLDIAKESGYPYLTVQNEISKHPDKARGGESAVLMTVWLTDDLAKRVDMAKGDEPTSRFVLRLLERGINRGGYAKAARLRAAATEAEVDRWVRMYGRGLSPAQIAEAVGAYPKDVSIALRSRLNMGPSTRGVKRDGTPRKLTVRMPLWLKNLLDAAAEYAGVSRGKVMQTLLGRELGREVMQTLLGRELDRAGA